MSGDIDRLGTGFQQNLQQVPAVQAQDGPAVAVQVAGLLQALGQPFGVSQAGQQDQMVYLAGAPVPLIDGADLPGHQEKGGLSRPAGQAVPVLQPVQSLPGLLQHFLQFFPPDRVGEVPGAHKAQALAPGPQVQVRGVAIPAGGPGVFGMDMQVRRVHPPAPFLLGMALQGYYTSRGSAWQMSRSRAKTRQKGGEILVPREILWYTVVKKWGGGRPPSPERERVRL